MVNKNNVLKDSLPERLAAVGVILRDDKFLVIKRALTESAPGACCFPGGGIDPGESEMEALVRELQEEVGIQSPNPIRCLWRSWTERNVNIAWWLTEISSDETLVANPAEVAEIYWWTPEEMIQSGLMLKSNLEFLDTLSKGGFDIENSSHGKANGA